MGELGRERGVSWSARPEGTTVDTVLEELWRWLPSVATVVAAIVTIKGALCFLLARPKALQDHTTVLRQLLVVALSGVFLIGLILSLPIGAAARGQLLSLLGLLVTAAIALSATTLVGNAMAGFMLRTIRNFDPGDFISVGEHRGRVSEKRILHVEIQNEARNLITLPNLYLVTHPITVVHSSGTFVSATVSLGYDVSRVRVEESLLTLAEAELMNAFVLVTKLGDFSITYRISGLLEAVKYLVTAESRLRECMLDALHQDAIEIVSPTFMNQRAVGDDAQFIPSQMHRHRAVPTPLEDEPEKRIFDKAEEASELAALELKLAACTQ